MRLVSAHLTVSPGLGYALVQVPQLARPGDGAMGLGWMMDPLPGTTHRLTWHNGTLPGYRSFVGFVADTYQSVVILTNTERPVDDLAHAILADLVNNA
jgi:CubicO group peptidase (beta-lactamase class C family)